MSEGCLCFEVNLEGDIMAQVPDVTAVEEEPAECVTSEEIDAPKSPPSTSLFSFAFLFSSQDEAENSVEPEITVQNEDGLDSDERTAVEVADVPSERTEAVASPPPPSQLLLPNPIRPSRSLLSMFQKKASPTRTQSYVYQEKPQLLDSDSDDDRSLEEAHAAEHLLGSTMRFAEEEMGDNFFSLSRAPRHDTIELGRRVSSLPGDKPGAFRRTPSLLLDDDDASIQSWASQATETSFIRVEKAEPGSFNREYWGGIVASMSLDAEDVASDVVAEPPAYDPSESKSPPRNDRVPTTLLMPPPNRKWDNLRNTLEAQEMGASLEDNKKANKFKKTRSLRLPKLGKGTQRPVDIPRQEKPKDEGDIAVKETSPRKTVVVVPRSKSTDEGDAPRTAISLFRSLGSLRQVKSHDDHDNFASSLGPLPPISKSQIVEGPSDVRINVEDLSEQDEDVKPDLGKRPADDDEDDDTKPDLGVDKSTDDTVASRDSDPELEASMEVLYMGGGKKSWLGNRGRFVTEIQG